VKKAEEEETVRSSRRGRRRGDLSTDDVTPFSLNVMFDLFAMDR